MADGSNEPKIRALVDADIPAVHAIYSNAVSTGIASWEYSPPTLEEMGSRIEVVRRAGYPYLVAQVEGAEGDDEIAGYAYASSYRGRPGYRFTVENSVYVSAAHHRRGIARALLTELIDHCSELGFRQMIAVIGAERALDHESASVALHRSLGFDQVARLPAIGFKFDRWLDSVIMQRSLGPGGDEPPVEPPDEPTW